LLYRIKLKNQKLKTDFLTKKCITFQYRYTLHPYMELVSKIHNNSIILNKFSGIFILITIIKQLTLVTKILCAVVEI
jgi:hypothetical protein